MNLLFYVVYRGLMGIAAATGLSYEAVNILVYYVLMPLVFFILIDKITRRHFCVIGFGLLLAGSCFLINDFNAFCERLFAASVAFLEGFSCLGLGYCLASVVVCVFAPLALLAVLLYFAYPKLVGRYFPTLKKLAHYHRKPMSYEC